MSSSDITGRLKAQGMLTPEEILAGFSKYEIHAAMDGTDFFEEWLRKKALQYIGHASKHFLDQREQGADYKETGIEDFILGKSSAFREVYINYMEAKRCESEKKNKNV